MSVLDDDMMDLEGVAKRSAFVIGADGTVTCRRVTGDPGLGPGYDAVRRAAVDAVPSAAS